MVVLIIITSNPIILGICVTASVTELGEGPVLSFPVHLFGSNDASIFWVDQAVRFLLGVSYF